MKNQHEPDPKESTFPPVWDEVIRVIKERDAQGQAKYHTKLKLFNGRNALTDAIQENLDMLVYLQQLEIELQGDNQRLAIQEKDKRIAELEERLKAIEESRTGYKNIEFGLDSETGKVECIISNSLPFSHDVTKRVVLTHSELAYLRGQLNSYFIERQIYIEE